MAAEKKMKVLDLVEEFLLDENLSTEFEDFVKKKTVDLLLKRTILRIMSNIKNLLL